MLISEYFIELLLYFLTAFRVLSIFIYSLTISYMYEYLYTNLFIYIHIIYYII